MIIRKAFEVKRFCDLFSNKFIAVMDINTPVVLDAWSQVGKVGLPPLSACLKLVLAIAAAASHPSQPLAYQVFWMP